MSVARQRAGRGSVEFSSTHDILVDVLKEIVQSYHLIDVILTGGREVRPWARVLVNGRSHEFLGGLNIRLHDGDAIALIYPYAESF